MAKEKTCCGSCWYGATPYQNYWVWYPGGDERGTFTPKNFCPDCGAYLPPNGGDPERRGETVGEAWALFHSVTGRLRIIQTDKPDYKLSEAEKARNANWFKRVLLVRPAEKPEEASDE